MPSRGPSPRARVNTPYVTLRTLARSHGRTQEDIAAQLGVTPKTLGKYETGARAIPSRLLVPFVEAYSIHAEDIVWGIRTEDVEDDEEPHELAVSA
jgi:transcriptional regulator with XRE-family HTH domain